MTNQRNAVLAAIAAEASRVEESAKHSAQAQFEMAKYWRVVHFTVAVPATVLAGVAGVTALSDLAGVEVAGWLALASAGSGALATAVNASRRGSKAAGSGNEYLAIQSAARQMRDIDLKVLTPEEARERLHEVTDRRDELNRGADPPSKRAYRKAKKNIAAGGQTYEVDTAPEEP